MTEEEWLVTTDPMQMSRYITVVLSGTGVTDVGLQYLAVAKGLVFLQLYGTKVTDAGVKRLKKALTKLKVER